jgi:hypothetical protein
LSHALLTTAAARHAKFRLRDLSVQKGSDELFDRAAAKPDHPDTGENQDVFQRRRDCAADENVCAHSQKLSGPGWTIRPAQSPLLAPDFPLILDVDQQDAAGDIEYGRDASLMTWNRKPHAMERSTRPATISTCCG